MANAKLYCATFLTAWIILFGFMHQKNVMTVETQIALHEAPEAPDADLQRRVASAEGYAKGLQEGVQLTAEAQVTEEVLESHP